VAVWAKNPITGYGVLFFGILPEIRSDYEIEVIKENDTPIKVSGRFYGSVEVPERIDKSKAMLELQDGECIKILISGDPKFSPINFDVVDNESIAICRDLRP
jgi:hypothetical protein